jgi:RNA polymerase sigma-70 factor, ECF subfamily
MAGETMLRRGISPEVTDAELILASRDDPRAFRELYDRWAERLLAYFYRRVLDAEVAADLLAETFAVAFERRHRFRDVGRPGGAWLYGIAAKELSHWFRRQEVERRAVRRMGLQVPPLDAESIARIEALVDADEHRAALSAALDQMTGGERDAVRLRVVGELGYTEIAARLGCSEGAARRRVHRGLSRLNNLMQAEATR